jgi:hypothetical protein
VAAWEADRSGELFAREIFLANPRSDHCQILYGSRTIQCIFFRRKKLNRAPSFAQRVLFSAETRID